MVRLASLPSILLLCATCGCAGLTGWTDDLNPFVPHYVEADAKNPAVEVACIWQPGEGRNNRGLPARGFSGQVFFFTRAKSEPALVDGTVRIYLFADRGTLEDDAKPLRQFDFMPEAWAAHATKTSLGPGYTVFVPYPENEPYQVRCQLRARFTPRQGPTIWSEAVTMVLEGPPRPGSEPAAWADADPNAPAAPTIANAAIAHRRGPVTDRSDRSTRSLRTETFELGGLELASHESPARLPETTVSPQEPGVTGRDAFFQARATSARPHPLQMSSPTAAEDQPHPLEAPPAQAAPRTTHPLASAPQPDRSSPDLTAEQLTVEPHSRRHRLSRPAGSNERISNSRAIPALAPVPKVRPLAEPPAITQEAPPNRTGYRSFGGRASIDSAPDYGVWRSLAE